MRLGLAVFALLWSAVAAARPTPIIFSASSVGQHWALEASATGSCEVFDDHLEILLTSLEVRHSATDLAGTREMESVFVGLGELERADGWDLIAKGSPLDVGHVLRPGESLTLHNLKLTLPLHEGASLSGRWLVIGLIDHSTGNPRARGESYLHTAHLFGDDSPDPELVTLDGAHLRLSGLHGKVVVLNFWFTGCGPCRQELPQLNRLVDRFRGHDKVVFLALALDEVEALRPFLATHPLRYQVVPAAVKTTQRFDVHLWPTHLVLDKQGHVAARFAGGGDSISRLHQAIEAAEQG